MKSDGALMAHSRIDFTKFKNYQVHFVARSAILSTFFVDAKNPEKRSILSN